MTKANVNGPHQGLPVLHGGAPFQLAKAAMILLHGRYASAEDILRLGDGIGRKDVLYLAPQAADHEWLPHTFREPAERQEPKLTSALAVVGGLVNALGEVGFPPEKIVLSGFSQGACLATHFAATHPRRYGGVMAFSGALIGDPVRAGDFSGSLEGTPVFMGCGDADDLIPLDRVHGTSEILRGLGAEVTERIYPGMGHTVSDDELGEARRLLSLLTEA
ncbi:phospholipase/carboxylesterase/glyoxalase family protein [Faunimonas pinastri]|uniref:Phospholipase/carboxylesterase/glyoxalase family protein n=1 Tax=Faunimonas pinastri TaxID=1855383 RepID=A0A1H9API6_9HYPH|nr:dienelactone hydrolase family protein [Faunimonas pinastri]SEP78461.1 phospholipase/carboxylesterase/glyoxalase family protein [Faunimonas pinastri]